MQSEFFSRLTDRTTVTAKLYLEADEISGDSLSMVREQYMERLPGEMIRIYNNKNNAAFIGDDRKKWDSETLEKIRLNKKIQFKEGNKQVVGIYYKDNQGDFVIIASAVDEGTIRRVEKLWKIMAAVFTVIFIVLLVTARWIAEKILLPLNVFIDQVKLIKSNSLHFRVNEGKNKDEIQLLAQNFNNLMEHLEHAFILQKTFVANASHELRTPVTRMIIGTEIALSRERSAENYKVALNGVLDDAEKLEKIISSLLNLAQADLEYGSASLERVRIDELMWIVQQRWNPKNGDSKLILEIKDLPADEELLILEANPTLLNIAIDNIISNAFKFSDGQQVKCILDFKKDGIHISITDAGIGIEEVQLQNIFKPFYSSSRKPEHAGNGMGLYMAQKIISLYNGNISVGSQRDVGTTFNIEFLKF